MEMKKELNKTLLDDVFSAGTVEISTASIIEIEEPQPSSLKVTLDSDNPKSRNEPRILHWASYFLNNEDFWFRM